MWLLRRRCSIRLVRPLPIANQVDPNDPALISTDVKYPSADGASINAYVTRPKGDGRRPAVIVVS